MTEQAEIFHPQFPALHMCVIIDARHSSRMDMIRDLKASNLFENIVEAKSIDDGRKIISGHAADALLLGPSVSLAKATSFLQAAKSESLSKDCALVAILPRDTTVVERETSHRMQLLSAGAHGVIETPCTKMAFTEQMVRAVVKANANSPWTGILLNAEKNGIDPFSGAKSAPRADSLSSVASKASPDLRAILESIESGEYELDANGKPTRKTMAAISKLVDSMLAQREAQSATPKFKQFFEEILVQYFLDLKQYGARDAVNELREKLATYRE